MRPIALIGSLCRDRVTGQPPRVGGMPYWATRALRLLGAPAYVATRCAAADRSQLVGPLIAHGLPVQWSEARETTAFSFRYDGERRLMEVDAVGDPWRVEDLPALAQAEWVHLGPLLRDELGADAVAELARRRRVSYDGQGLVRRAERGPLRLDAEYDPALLAHVDVLKLAEEEASTLVGEITADSLASLNVSEIVVTYGSHGSAVFAEGELTRVPARPVTADPTGAGDAFAAVYVASRAGGYRPVAAARRATALVAALLNGTRR